jgi:hypothetical protein
MVAGVVRYLGAVAVGSIAWARVDFDGARSQTGALRSASPTGDWGDEQGQVAPRVYGLSVEISGDIRSSYMNATWRSFSTLRLSRMIS